MASQYLKYVLRELEGFEISKTNLGMSLVSLLDKFNQIRLYQMIKYSGIISKMFEQYYASNAIFSEYKKNTYLKSIKIYE